MLSGYLDHVAEDVFLKAIDAATFPFGVVQRVKAFSSPEALYNALKSGKIDIAALLLTDVPLQLPPELTIAALRGRKEKPSVGLTVLKKKSKNAENAIDFLNPDTMNGAVWVNNYLQKTQLLDLAPRVGVVVQIDISIPELIKSVRDGASGGCLLSAFSLQQSKANGGDLLFFPFHRQELIPAPGDGAYAFIALVNDITTRRALLQIHQSGLAMATNVERKLQQIVEDSGKKVAAYCEFDRAGYYHIWAANEAGKRVRTSSATHFSLAEAAAALLEDAD